MAMPQNMEDLNKAIADQIRAAFPDQQIDDIKKLAAFFPGYNEFTAEFVAVKRELETIRAQLDQAIPKLADTVQEGISDLEKRAGAAHASVTSSVDSLEKRGREISEKLVETFKKIDSQLEAVSLQVATVQS